jgi:hypothetical protein
MTAPTYIRIVDDDEDYNVAAFYNNGDHWEVWFRGPNDQNFKLRVPSADYHVVRDLLNRYQRRASGPWDQLPNLYPCVPLNE